jgi:hypothetical protein
LLLAALLAAVLLLARARGGAPGLVRDFFPVLVVLAVFSILQPVIEASNPRRYDALFAAADARWLGPLVEAWRAAFGRARLFTDAVYVVYASYYLYPVAICGAARRRGPASLERAIFPLLLAYYLSFVGPRRLSQRPHRHHAGGGGGRRPAPPAGDAAPGRLGRSHRLLHGLRPRALRGGRPRRPGPGGADARRGGAALAPPRELARLGSVRAARAPGGG